MNPVDAFVEYLGVGFEHILPLGLDHILFVIGLFLLSTVLKPLVIQITAFTVAHTVTLALGATGVVNLLGSVVEPLIALSIAYVAVENVTSEKLRTWRPVIVFLFGLLHGLGFAGVLSEFGFAPGQFVASLIAFNIGVEIGQLVVIAVCFLTVGLWFGGRDWYRP
ncbi:MAG: HupE/UreJ family protein, partial [Pseudomonadota bacterium]